MSYPSFSFDLRSVGSKVGGGGVASQSESNRDRRERLRKLALETIGGLLKLFASMVDILVLALSSVLLLWLRLLLSLLSQ